jgi:hypothetical protein
MIRSGEECEGAIGVADLVHRVISRRHTAVGDWADSQGANDEHI